MRQNIQNDEKIKMHNKVYKAQCTMHTVVPHVLAWLAWLSCSHALIACHKRTRGAFLHFCISAFLSSQFSALREVCSCTINVSSFRRAFSTSNSIIIHRFFFDILHAALPRVHKDIGHWTLDIGHTRALLKPGVAFRFSSCDDDLYDFQGSKVRTFGTVVCLTVV